MTKMKSLDDLFMDTLKDIYYAEKQILKALPKMEKAAESDALRNGFATHREQTVQHVDRLEKIFSMMDQTPRGKKCEAIEGILKEGAGIIEDFGGTPAIDAGLISAAQAVEHYEIARYGTLKRWAEVMGQDEAVALLDETLNEEADTDETLTQLAQAANDTASSSVQQAA